MLKIAFPEKLTLRRFRYKDEFEGKETKCIIGYMACQAGIPIPEHAGMTEIGALTEFKNEISITYELSPLQLFKLQRANDEADAPRLTALLKEYGILEEDAPEIEFKAKPEEL